MSLLSKLWKRYGINPLNRLLLQAKKEKKTKFLLCWNRGLGDIPLGIYPLIHKIRKEILDARITLLTRKDLSEGFSLLQGIEVLIDPKWARNQPFEIDPSILDEKEFDVIIKHPDPTAWLMKEQKKIAPCLQWKKEWDCSLPYFETDKVYIAAHVETQTSYGYEKNWPIAHWQELFTLLPKEWGIILVGGSSATQFSGENLMDLRGKTNLIELLSLIKNRCRYLIAPDSGILSIVYYINASYPLKVISLWADPKQGILKQASNSPNPLLEHIPLLAPLGDLRKLTPQQVFDEVAL